jgi:hypothetical protein
MMMRGGGPGALQEVFARDGVAILEKVLGPDDLRRMGGAFSGGAGQRHGTLAPGLLRWIEDVTCLPEVVVRLTGKRHRLVRAIAFDKTPAANWFVPWHQDRTIAVLHRADVAGFEHWSLKDGMVHVEAPAALLGDMVTLRVHLDDCVESNGPLEVLPGTHRSGKLARPEIARLVRAEGSRACLAERGDVLGMRPLLLHRSQRAAVPGRRRVLHLEFAATALPPPLRWSIDEAIARSGIVARREHVH